jgi:glutamine phosphoribosylpyrophosphate amidotransferase
MCGIVGFISNRADGATILDAKIMRELAIADIVRGYDGTGMFYRKKKSGDKDTKIWYYKGPKLATDLLSRYEWQAQLDEARFCVVHNRASTIGGNTEENTHPFVEAHVVGVHNGTLSGWRGLSSTARMDSHAMFVKLSDTDPDPAEVAQVLASSSVVYGAYSLVWWDHRIERLRFTRNYRRPMHMITTERGVFFGSELRMVEWILDRNEVHMYDSWSTKEYIIIDVPMDGSEAEVYDYSDEIYSYKTPAKEVNSGYDSGYGWDNRVSSGHWPQPYVPLPGGYDSHYPLLDDVEDAQWEASRTSSPPRDEKGRFKKEDK